MTILVEAVRSGFVESVHHGRVLVVDAEGHDVLRIGDVDSPIFPRSANKPLQAVGMLRAGLAAGPEQTVLVSASHDGTPEHVRVVRDILSQYGLDPSDLGCPADWPSGGPARLAAIRNGDKSPLFMNCSGKHAGMLVTCVVNGWDTATYLDPDHPVQRTIAATVAELAGQSIDDIGVDGCGAPILALSLRGLTRAFTRLVTTHGGPERQVADAVRAFPDLLGGPDRAISRLIAAVPRLVGKDGAEGVWAAALPGVGAVAVKIDDGAGRAAVPVITAALRRLGIDAPELAEPVLGGGRPVGELRAVLPD